MIKKQWKVIQGFSIAAVLVSTLSLLVTGWQGMAKYVNLLWEINQNLTDRAHQVRFALYPRAMANLRGLLYTLFSGQISDTVITIISASFSLIVLTCLCVYLSRKDNAATTIDLEFSLGIVAMLLVAIHLHLYDWSLLMMPILLLLNNYGAESAAGGRTLWTLRFTMLLLLMTPVYMVLITLELTSILVVPLLFFAYLIQREISNLRHPPPAADLAVPDSVVADAVNRAPC